MEQWGERTARQRCYGRRDKWKTIEVSYDVGENHMGGEGGKRGRQGTESGYGAGKLLEKGLSMVEWEVTTRQ